MKLDTTGTTGRERFNVLVAIIAAFDSGKTVQLIDPDDDDDEWTDVGRNNFDDTLHFPDVDFRVKPREPREIFVLSDETSTTLGAVIHYSPPRSSVGVRVVKFREVIEGEES